MKSTGISRNRKVKFDIEFLHYIDLKIYQEELERAAQESKYYNALYNSQQEKPEYEDDEMALLTVRRYEKAIQKYNKVTHLLDTCHCLPDSERDFYESQQMEAMLIMEETEEDLIHKHNAVFGGGWVF